MSFVYYLGTRPVLPYLPNQVPLDGYVEKIRTLDQTPDGGVSYNTKSGGRHCHTDNFPTQIEWRGRSHDPANIGDFDTGAAGIHISDRAKIFIETAEAAIHQFVPLEVLKAKKSLQKRFWWVVGNRIDSIDHERTNDVLVETPIGRTWQLASDLLRRGQSDLIPAGVDPTAASKRDFSSGQIGSACVWCDKYLHGGPLVSQGFADALKASDLTGYHLTEAGAVF